MKNLNEKELVETNGGTGILDLIQPLIDLILDRPKQEEQGSCIGNHNAQN
ncbi:hypothetical protein [Aquimarina sp. AD10]|nr:hypothetical protein [Aquimarina sp. AD10]